MFALRAFLIILFSIAGAASASAFDMVAKHTDWFTITVQQSSPDAPPLFLTRHGNSVALEPYISGDAAQMWTTAADFYPHTAPVTSDSGIDLSGLLSCLTHARSGCPFQVSVRLPVVKIVNRESQGCLVASGSGANTVKCGATQSLWGITPDSNGDGFGTISNGADCLTSGSARRPFSVASAT